MKFWKKVNKILDQGNSAVLMQVVYSEGSSPGRQGFRMLVSQCGKLIGSIGGGVMEHKMVELSKHLIVEGRFEPILRMQIHQVGLGHDRSGMICSGRQIIGLYFIDDDDLNWVEDIVKADDQSLSIKMDEIGISIKSTSSHDTHISFAYKDIDKWIYVENLKVQNSIYIVGGGHVSKALSKVMNNLGFRVVVIDDRENLNTIVNNKYAHKIICCTYDEIKGYIPEGDSSYIVIVSFGYRTDDICIRQLLGRSYKYFGVMGSKAKMRELLQGLIKDQYPLEELTKIRTPIGLQINSQTPKEIAISIAAEIIATKNNAILTKSTIFNSMIEVK